MEREACVCDHGFERSDLCAEIIITIIINARISSVQQTTIGIGHRGKYRIPGSFFRLAFRLYFQVSNGIFSGILLPGLCSRLLYRYVWWCSLCSLSLSLPFHKTLQTLYLLFCHILKVHYFFRIHEDNLWYCRLHTVRRLLCLLCKYMNQCEIFKTFIWFYTLFWCTCPLHANSG